MGLRGRMGSIERRIQQLEDLYHESPRQAAGLEERRAALRAELRELAEHGREKAEREAEAGDPRRLNALKDLEESVRRRRGA